ncbi:phenylalanine--tRNA ligase subunit alpha [Candidatus Roizmanbacteria bacterium]|nr:phenylalanine--tRNA ligase subunit alpha [Candidatus Roizmanbacteria bacterium]
MDDIQTLLNTFQEQLSSTTTLTDLTVLETSYLGRNGTINNKLKNIGAIPPEERKQYGAAINDLKKAVETALLDRKSVLLKEKDTATKIDVTLPGTAYPHGSLHMVTYAVEEISRIFSKIGFIRMTYPEVEWEHFSFEALNIPKTHPARDDVETFFVDGPESEQYGKMVLSPHTSSGQVREMLRVGKPPIRMISIGKCYRPNWDVTHVPMFHQFEALCVDTTINITNLKGTIDYFVKEFFGENRESRLRPHHFQFTEPSFEVDITCGECLGTGEKNGAKCRVCKSGWLELAGAGMVHPNVLKAGGLDPDKYTAWAFAFGLERMMMMKEGIKLSDMRIMYSGDVKFLEQF